MRSLPRTHHLNYAGIATGQGLADAAERALLEVVERDALELWWHLDGPTRGVDPGSVPGLDADLAGSGLEVSIVEMPSEFAPCVAALVHDAGRGVHAAGFACRFDPAEAARKAVLEAVHTWVFTLGAEAADGWVHQAVDAASWPAGSTWTTGPTAATSTTAARSSPPYGTWAPTSRPGSTRASRPWPAASPHPPSAPSPSPNSRPAAGTGSTPPSPRAATAS
ncbi:YcaO-like family protein [Actinomadura keratinilytica]